MSLRLRGDVVCYTNSMKYPIVSSDRVKMSPSIAVNRLESVLERDGKERALKSDSFQKVRESWVAGVFCLGYATKTKQEYWIQEISKKEEPPDLIIYSYRDPQSQDEIGVVREKILTEITEYPTYSRYGLVEHIKSKLNNKRYHPETWLICYIQRPGEAMRLIDVIEGLQNFKIYIREIWLLFHTDGKTPSNFNLERVYSRGMKVKKISLSIEGDIVKLSQKPQKKFLNDSRGMDKKVTIKKGKKVIVPLPKDRSKRIR